MGEYIKPVALTNDDLAEGVFLASGSGPLDIKPWYNGNILHFTITFNGVEEETYTLHQFVLEFNEDVSIANAIGNITCSGKIMTVNRTWEFSATDNVYDGIVIQLNESHSATPKVISYN